MASRWHQKKEKLRIMEEERQLQAMEYDSVSKVKDQARPAALGAGEEELFERKMSKEEKKAAAKAAREAKRKLKQQNSSNVSGGDDDEEPTASAAVQEVQNLIETVKRSGDVAEEQRSEAAEQLAQEGTIVTFSASRKGVDARSRDVNIQNVTLLHKGVVMLDETEIVLNHGNRYGLIGRNGVGKSTLMKALGARAVPIPSGIDIFHLKEEIEPSDTMTALEAVMSVDEERARLEMEAEKLNSAFSLLSETADDNDNDATIEEQQEQITDLLNDIYERLDALDAETAETRARAILKGLGFTHSMQSKLTKDFSGGWRMRVSLARALFIQPTLLLLDEVRERNYLEAFYISIPTNHLDMEAVIWLENYLSKWDRILLLISHSQDFLNNVCTHMIHFTNKGKLVYYDGNYDQFVKTKREKEENQLKQYKWEQDQIKSMKEYIARFGHGTAKNARQAQSKEKVLEKMVRSGLTEKPEEEKPMNFKFPDPGHLPPPVLAFHDVSFGYPGCSLLYSEISFGIDLDSRIALVGPNGAGKTTLVKLMSGELQPVSGDIRPHMHLKMGRFTQHFVDVLDLNKTPLEFFGELYPDDPVEDLRKYLGRFGVSGKMQVQQMEQLSDGQKSRVVFAKLGRERPHILLLDEPTNHLDMESIDALATAVQQFKGGVVLVSHDMRLISQVANEIWICDKQTVQPYQGDISSFKMSMRVQMGIDEMSNVTLRGDASQNAKDLSKTQKPERKAVKKPVSIETVKAPISSPIKPQAILPTRDNSKPTAQCKKSSPDAWGSDDEDLNPAPTDETKSSTPINKSTDAWGSDDDELKHLSKNLGSTSLSAGKYVPPHLRSRT